MKSKDALKILIVCILITLVHLPTAFAQPAGTQYLGCFKDTEDRDFKEFTQWNGNQTLESCTTVCKQKGFKYAALQYGIYCYCGNAYGKYGKATNCDVKCGGNSNEICGGSWANSVYDVSTGGTASTGTTPGITGTTTTVIAPPAGQIDLTGVWKDDRGATYSIRQLGTQIWWYMDGKPQWANVFKGNKSGNAVTGEWCDVPGGRLGNMTGTLTLRIVNNNRLDKVSASPAYGGSSWTRLR